MKIMKTFVDVREDGRRCQHLVDTIEYQGKFWLVPEWIDSPDEGMTMPVRIICLSNLLHQKSRMKGRDFVLTHTIPKDVLDGRVPLQDRDKFLIVERPPIRIRGGTGLN